MSTPLVTKATLVYAGEFEPKSSKHKIGEKDGNKNGLRTGMPILVYVNELFAANQKAKRPDGELLAELLAEYPNRPAVQSISAYRGYYKAGKHGLNPDGKGECESYGKVTGDVKPKKDLSHPNVIGNRDPATYGHSKELAKQRAKERAAAKAAAEPATTPAKPAPAKVKQPASKPASKPAAKPAAKKGK